MGGNMVKFDEFKKMDLRVGRIKDVKLHPNADKLYLLTVDLGGEDKQLVAGIRPYYKPDELTGRNVVVLANLEPATIRGVESHGMVLVAKTSETMAILAPEKDIAPGSPIS